MEAYSQDWVNIYLILGLNTRKLFSPQWQQWYDSIVFRFFQANNEAVFFYRIFYSSSPLKQKNLVQLGSKKQKS